MLSRQAATAPTPTRSRAQTATASWELPLSTALTQAHSNTTRRQTNSESRATLPSTPQPSMRTLRQSRAARALSSTSTIPSTLSPSSPMPSRARQSRVSRPATALVSARLTLSSTPLALWAATKEPAVSSQRLNTLTQIIGLQLNRQTPARAHSARYSSRARKTPASSATTRTLRACPQL